MYRILRGINVQELSSVRLKYSAVQNVSANTILLIGLVDLYRDITDTDTPSSANLAALNAFAAHRWRPPQNGAQLYLQGVEYKCMLCRNNEHASTDCHLLNKLWENQRLSPKGNIFYSRNARKVVVIRPRADNANDRKGTTTAKAAQAFAGATLSADEALQRAADKYVNEHAAQHTVKDAHSCYPARTLIDTAASITMVREPLPNQVLKPCKEHRTLKTCGSATAMRASQNGDGHLSQLNLRRSQKYSPTAQQLDC